MGSLELLGEHDGKYGSANDEEANWWKFADFGHVGELSRDGSVHVTDEVVNSATHLAASVFSVLGTAMLISESSAQADPWKIVSFSLYGASLLFLFVCSTLHHSVSASAIVEQRLRMMDYLAIYPLIAGSFTPLCLVFYHDSVIGWTFFGSVWLLAVGGMVLTATLFGKIPKWMSMTLYISLGWVGAFMAYWLIPMIGMGGITLLVLGGVLYTIGGYFYTTEQPNPIPGHFGFHEIWHIFVVLAAATHWCMMYFYVLPWKP